MLTHASIQPPGAERAATTKDRMDSGTTPPARIASHVGVGAFGHRNECKSTCRVSGTGSSRTQGTAGGEGDFHTCRHAHMQGVDGVHGLLHPQPNEAYPLVALPCKVWVKVHSIASCMYDTTWSGERMKGNSTPRCKGISLRLRICNDLLVITYCPSPAAGSRWQCALRGK